MTDLRKGPNGYLYAPARGTPPDCPEGYDPAPGNKFLFLPSMPYCTIRETQTTVTRCCGPIMKFVCKSREGYVTRLDCKECTCPVQTPAI